MKYKTIDNISASVTDLLDGNIGFAIYNETGKGWEVGIEKHNGMQYYLEGPRASGLIFSKESASNMAKILRLIADELEGNNGESI